jgi:hypothetical protein
LNDNTDQHSIQVPSSYRLRWEIVAAFAFGVVFLTTILVTALFKPDPTPYQYAVFRIVLALAAAGIGAILPGFFEIRNKVVSAGGALAMFLVVFFGAPAALSPVLKEPEEISDNAQPIIEQWFKAMDSRDLRAAYDQTSFRFQNQYTYSQFEQLTTQYMGSLGNVTSRKFYSSSFAQSPPGAPVGRYQYNMYETNFEKFGKPLYMNVTVIGESRRWKVFGFALAARNEQGILIPFDPATISAGR